MTLRDRRTPATDIHVRKRRMGLTAPQAQVLDDCERHGWKLAFIREPLEHPMPVLFATARDFVVVREDGSIDRDPTIELRH
ncbi:hypothetical protein [Lysobacter sp. GCM10012299]|uniref:hypothetical protein n=1 Tax=Lysobacter sp. GCM10012299 TaxID=3317333 RepID=UPI0036117582